MGIDRLFKGIKKGTLTKIPFIVIALLYGGYSLLFIISLRNHIPKHLPMITNIIKNIGSKISILSPNPGFSIAEYI